MTGHPHLGPTGYEALQLLAVCPRVPTDVACQLLGAGHPGSVMQVLARLSKSGFVRTETASPGPLLSARHVRLWSLTGTGRAVLTARGWMTPSDVGPPFGSSDRSRASRRQTGFALLIASYRVLARVVAGVDGPCRVAAWEHPWVRVTEGRGEATRQRHIRLAAAAALVGLRETMTVITRLLIIPDLGTAPVSSYRGVISALLRLREQLVDEARLADRRRAGTRLPGYITPDD